MKYISRKLLYLAECLYLLTHGWEQDRQDPKQWIPPKDYPGPGWKTHGYAVNAQKFHSREAEKIKKWERLNKENWKD